MRRFIYRVLVGLLLFSTLGDAAETRSISPEAQKYLERALGIMQANALHSERIDWATLRRQTFERAGAAEVPANTYDAIRWALKLRG